MPLGTGLERDTVRAYKKEWKMYIEFCNRKKWKRIPGRDVAWNIRAVEQYLRWRAKKNNIRTLTQIKSKLKHCGLCHDFLLPTAKGEGPSKLRLQIVMVSKAISKQQKRLKLKLGKLVGPKRALALGRTAVSLLFSAYGATDRTGFEQVPTRARHFLVICICMHTGCMRFKLMQEMQKKGVLKWSQPNKTYIMKSKWRKMKKRTTEYSVKFPQRPKYKAMIYSAYSADGKMTHTFTAAQVLRWQEDLVQSARGTDLFAPTHEGRLVSRHFRTWLRSSFERLLAESCQEVRQIVQAITPHSFRAGLATDLEREDVSRTIIMKTGRWASARAMEQYIRDGLAQQLPRIRFYRITSERNKARRVSLKSTSAIKEELSEDASGGYDDSAE